MKYIILLLIFVSAVRASAQGIAVLELFTSQGCSSCPAADKYLTQVIQDAEKNGKPIYGLSFHVDYWNHIGWKDPYCDARFTDRQKNYAERMPLKDVYTPQIVINGQRSFVGSDKTYIEKFVDESLAQNSSYTITISDPVVADGNVQINYSIDKSPSNATINFAIVERELENFVPRGENNGKTLRHDNVVRVFKSMRLKKNGVVELKLPEINLAKSSIIAYAQDSDLHVVAATGKALK